MNKRAISAIVATVLIILIVIAGIGILWGAILPLVRNNLDTQEFDVDLSIDTSQGYTAYDSDAGLMSVQVRRGADDVDLAGLAFTITSEGNSVTRIFDDVPESNQARRYDLFLEKGSSVDSIGVAPIYSKGGSSEQGVVLSGVENLAEADLNSVDENGEGKNLYAGLVSYWSFDEGVEDDYGENDGEIWGEVDCSVEGVSEKACGFDGEEGISFRAGDEIITNDDSWTIFTAFNADQIYTNPTQNRMMTFHRRDDRAGTTTALLVGGDDNAIFAHYDSGENYNYDDMATIETGRWYFFAVSYNGTTYRVFVNGEETEIEDSFLGVNSYNMTMGAYQIDEGPYFYGKIDDSGVFSRALSFDEMDALREDIF